MCTLTFFPRGNGYVLAMNRDERLARGTAAPPSRVGANGVEAIYPRDVEGGTWIAANAFGIALALLNWNDVPCDANKAHSRGVLIPWLIAGSTSHEVHAALEHMDLRGILPFRAAGFFPGEKQILEWRWDMALLRLHWFPWERRHWFSSSLSDTRATELRGAVCDHAWNEAADHSISWLRQLYASHDNAGLAICVHRDAVQTLSYTEVTCSPAHVGMKYFNGSPCAMGKMRHSLDGVELQRCDKTHEAGLSRRGR